MSDLEWEIEQILLAIVYHDKYNPDRTSLKFSGIIDLLRKSVNEKVQSWLLTQTQPKHVEIISEITQDEAAMPPPPLFLIIFIIFGV